MDAQKRLIRKEILRILKVAGELGATAELIAQSLYDGGYPTTGPAVEAHLRYLAGAGKGYVYIREHRTEQLGRRLTAKLTPRGIDLLEGNIEADPGIA